MSSASRSAPSPASPVHVIGASGRSGLALVEALRARAFPNPALAYASLRP